MSRVLPGLIRTHHCGELNATSIGTSVTVVGWVNKSRDLGGLHFLDLRDKYGLTQLNFQNFKGDLSLLKKATLESVVMAKGTVRGRPPEAQNKNMLTGEIEVEVTDFEILSSAAEVPFLPHGSVESTEDLRLKYRYLDLRSTKLQNILELRSKVTTKVRKLFTGEGFIEVETPILYKSTPEGARDYLVPSRVHPGKVYALPQSPQTLKQLLMIAGTDKYFQICKCFRDEDLRADRQPEFTQIDFEVSFVTPTYIKNIVTKLIKELFALDDSFSLPTMTYQDAMTFYGTDRPDLRFGLKHRIVTDFFAQSAFTTFKEVAEQEGLVKAIFVPATLGQLTRKDTDDLKNIVAPFGAKGVAWFKVENGQRSGGISKFIDDGLMGKLLSSEGSESASGDGTWFFVADKDHRIAHASTDALRKYFLTKFQLSQKDYAFVWVYDFPLLEYDDKAERFVACHHPFTAPHPEDLEGFFRGDSASLKKCRALAYDIVCNGHELGGGSIRIHNSKVQETMFKILGMEEHEIQHQFGFFVEALKYGTPPHGGLAFGLDRLIMMLAKTENIRDVIAFPKTSSAADLMSSCPSSPGDKQTQELHFQWRK